MAQFDTVVRGGTIVDGAGTPRFEGDLGIKDGVIAAVGGTLDAAGAKLIDAAGLIVAPGVIDTHTHYDAQLHWDPYCTNSGWHGTTTVGVGNCGFGFAPCRPENRDRYMQMMETTEQVPVNALRVALGWEWESFPEWMEHLKSLPKGVNVASYVPLNPLLIYVMGLEAAKTRSATAEERAQMKALLNEAMDIGAIGFGFSFQGDHNTHIDCDGQPMPTDIMNPDDIYALAEVLRERGDGSVQALVDTPGARNTEVALNVARISGRPVVHNITLVNDYVPTYHEEMLAMLDAAEAEGLDVYSMTLTTRGWNEFKPADWDIWNILPIFREFTFAGDKAAKIEKAKDEAFRQRLRAEYRAVDLAPAGGPLETYQLNNAHGVQPWASYEGKTMGDIAQALGREWVTDVFMDIVVDTDADADFMLPDALSCDLEKIAQVLRHPRTIPGTSDGGAHVKFWAGGQYSTDMIMWLTRETDTMSLEDVHAKLSALPARVLGLTNRGTLAEGMAADLLIYDHATIGFRRKRYDIAHDLPDGDWRRVVKPEGIRYVLVNGEVTFVDGTDCTGATPGHLIGGSGAAIDRLLAEPLALAAE